MSSRSSRRIISSATVSTSAVTTFSMSPPSVRARFARSRTSSPVPWLISCSNRRDHGDNAHDGVARRLTSRIRRPSGRTSRRSCGEGRPARLERPRAPRPERSARRRRARSRPRDDSDRPPDAGVTAASSRLSPRIADERRAHDPRRARRSRSTRPGRRRGRHPRGRSHQVNSPQKTAQHDLGSGAGAGHARLSAGCGFDAAAGAARAAAAPGRAVLERQAAAMRLGDLPAQADARPAGLGGEERHEQVAGVRQPGPSSSTHSSTAARRRRAPADADAAAGLATASTALRTRLMSSCSSWSGSAWIVTSGPPSTSTGAPFSSAATRSTKRRRRPARSFGGGSARAARRRS